jgi:hypothetical protein
MEFIKHKSKYIAVHIFNWNQQPDLDAIAAFINQRKYNQSIKIHYIETGSNEHAIVICPISIDEAEAKFHYDNRYAMEQGDNYEDLDWSAAKEHLDNVRMQYTQIGAAGLSYLNSIANPLLIQYERQDRTLNLYEEIMKLS